MLGRLNQHMVKIHIFCFVFFGIGAFAIGSGSILHNRWIFWLGVIVMVENLASWIIAHRQYARAVEELKAPAPTGRSVPS